MTTRLRGLDGLRALAVAAVVAFHLDAPWLPGGFLGVDLFFVLSGFLITRRLLRTDLRLRDFYAGRARRILPAAVVVVVACVAAGLVLWRHQGGQLRGDVLAALAFATNWWEITRDASYFVAAGPPSPLRHFWSLAVEEQFYLLWPCVVALAFRGYALRPDAHHPDAPHRYALRRYALRRYAWTGGLALAGALASAAAMAGLAIARDVPFNADPSRVYYGTDTHAMGLLLGAAAAAWLPRRRIVEPVPWLTDATGFGCLAVLAAAMLTADQSSPGLYRGGFLLLSIAALGLVLATGRPGSLPGRLLDVAPLRWIGVRSYEIYLWHWPVIALLTDLGVVGTARAAVAVPAAVALAAATHKYVTRPIWHPEPTTAPTTTVPTATVQTTTVPLLRPRTLAVCAGVVALVAAALPLSNPPPPVTATMPAVDPSPAPLPSAPPAPAGGPIFQHPSWVQGPISAFGDSVMLGAQDAMSASMPRIRCLATVSASPDLIFSRVYEARSRGRLAHVVVVHAGDNGLLRPSDVDQLLATLADRTLVVLVTDKIPEAYGRRNNSVLTSVAARHPNAVIADWARASRGHDGWFAYDQTHLQPAGARAFAQLITDAIAIGPR
ncbi:acyltransferase family protein [Hamadaea tsunoensis]|uniref:acyltransferase family protein n=1 Tax=Hamadaea tsunoensis TaxID=53368 RepID=UPI000426C15D|nr:acyltransferase family protein [Hamadaea tsunoensis]